MINAVRCRWLSIYMRIVHRIYGPIGSADLENSMRKLIVAEHISLDGVIQAPGRPDEDPSGEFRLGGWTVPHLRRPSHRPGIA